MILNNLLNYIQPGMHTQLMDGHRHSNTEFLGICLAFISSRLLKLTKSVWRLVNIFSQICILI